MFYGTIHPPSYSLAPTSNACIYNACIYNACIIIDLDFLLFFFPPSHVFLLAFSFSLSFSRVSLGFPLDHCATRAILLPSATEIDQQCPEGGASWFVSLLFCFFPPFAPASARSSLAPELKRRFRKRPALNCKSKMPPILRAEVSKAYDNRRIGMLKRVPPSPVCHSARLAVRP